MANQIIIDIGAVANDGTGDPLRTAFNYVNNNFSNVWASGVANSNIQFDGNRILTTNTNGNLVLSPNGIGKVQANVDIVPNANNTLSLGSLTRQWNTVYAQNLTVAGDTTFNNLTVNGNLTVEGDTIQIGNIVTDTKTIQLANTAGTTTAANGSGITVGANDNIATLLYSSTSNVWTTNIGVSVTGNISGTYFIGNGSQLTGIASPYGNANVSAYLASGADTANIITSGNVTGAYISGNIVAPGFNQDIVFNQTGVLSTASGFNYNYAGNILYAPAAGFSGDAVTGVNGLFVGHGSYTELGSDIVGQFTSEVNAYSQINSQNTSNGVAASGDYVITADNGTDSTHFINLGITSSTWNGSQPNSLGNRLGPNDGYLYVQDGDMVIGTSNGNIETWKFDQTGNLTVPGDILPVANNTQSLGNATNQWSDLYVSNATIYMNNVPISLTAGNVLTVNSQPVLINDSNTSITTTGNISADFFIGDGSQLTNLPFDASKIENGTSNVEIATANGNVTVTAAGSATWLFDITGNLAIPGTIVSDSTVRIDNRESGITADIQLYSADDILLQARDRTLGDDAEGGDINIYAGDGAPDDNGSGNTGGGDIQIIGGVGGAAGNAVVGDNGGTVRLDAGGGGEGSANAAAGSGGTAYLSAGSGGGNFGGGGNSGGDVVITGGDTTDVAQDRGSVILNAGGGGDETSLGGYVQVSIPSVGANPGGQWTFTGSGTTLETPANAEIFGPNFGNLTVGAAGNTIITSADYGITTYNWVFDNTGNLNLPNNGSINFNAGGITQATDEDFVITVNDADDDGFAIFNRITDDSNLVVAETEMQRDRFEITVDAQGAAYNWQFSDNEGILYLPGNVQGNYGASTSFYATDNGSGGSMEMKTVSYIGDTLGSNIRVTQNNATISTGNAAYTWTFDNTGNLTVPGNTIVSTANATSGSAGKSITIRAGAADQTDYYTTPGGNVNITGGLGASNDGGGGGQGGFVNITSGASADPAGVAGNVTINAGSSTWTFDYNNKLSSGPLSITSQYGLGTTGTILENGGTLELIGNGTGGGTTGCVIVGWNSSYGTAGNVAQMYFNPADSTGNIVVTTGNTAGTSYEWTFDNTGNLTVPGSIIGTVAQATLANTVAVSSVLLNQEYVPALLVANTGNLGIKAADGTANITYNPSLNRLTVENIDANTVSLGNASTITTADYAIGYRDIPQISFTGNATIATTDAGKHYYSTQSSNYILTIANNASQGFQVGAAITIVNQGTGNITVAQGSGVALYMAGNATSGNRSVATFGMATIMKVSTDTWFINGTGVS